MAILILGVGGVGRELAERLWNEGEDLWLGVHRPTADMEKWATRARAQLRNVEACQPTSVEALFDELARRHVPLSAVIDTIGPFPVEPLCQTTSADMAALWQTHGGLLVQAANLARPFLRESQGKLIVFTHAGVEAWRGYREVAAYAACKAGVLSLVRSLALQWLEEGVAVHAVAPGVLEGAPAWQAAVLAKQPGAGPTRHEDLHRVIRFLLDFPGCGLTGQNITVSNGFAL